MFIWPREIARDTRDSSYYMVDQISAVCLGQSMLQNQVAAFETRTLDAFTQFHSLLSSLTSQCGSGILSSYQNRHQTTLIPYRSLRDGATVLMGLTSDMSGLLTIQELSDHL